MKTSEKTESLIAALLKARAAFPAIHKDKTAKVPTKSGGQYQYNYADLSSIIDATKDPLIANGLMLQHGMESNGHTILTCRLSHVSGQWQESAYPIAAGVDAQQMGSAITYGRRYTACAMLGIVTEDDDDGEAAKAPQQQAAPKQYALKPVAPVKPAAPQPADEDRVPAEVTDGQAPAAPAEDVEIRTLKAYSKEKTDKGGKPYRGVLLGEGDWWNCYDAETIKNLPNLKEKRVYAKLETKGTFKLCHNLTEVAGG
jgi:hypothetical protein